MSADNKPALGRPIKGKDRRVSIALYITSSLIEPIDEYVRNRQNAGERSYSRSEFINEAIEKHMRDVGLKAAGGPQKG